MRKENEIKIKIKIKIKIFSCLVGGWMQDEIQLLKKICKFENHSGFCICSH